MTTESTPDLDEPIGWVVTDPDGNVVDSGPVTEAHAVAWVGELLQQNLTPEGEQ